MARSWQDDGPRCYPTVHSFSDFFVVSGSALEEFAHLCGVFAVVGTFVESAIPTAMVLCMDKIVQYKDIAYSRFEDGIFPHGRKDYAEAYKNDYGRLVAEEFSSGDQLFVHPVKLSMFRNIEP